MNVLIADDDPVSRLLLSKILIEEGTMEICSAEDGEEALRMLEDTARRFDVLFLDLQMPKVDGISVLRKLRDQGPNFEKPKIIICSTACEDHKGACWELGARLFITKPALRESVRQKLHLALSS
jgi:osomolarity two-component system sensor histidine kinase SLN1